MTGTEEIPRTFEEAVQTLARWHGEGGPADLRIFFYSDPAHEWVRLVEVSSEFLRTGSIRPLTLGRSELFPFRSSVALATPEEWSAVEAGTLPLPPDWGQTSRQQVWP